MGEGKLENRIEGDKFFQDCRLMMPDEIIRELNSLFTKQLFYGMLGGVAGFYSMELARYIDSVIK